MTSMTSGAPPGEKQNGRPFAPDGRPNADTSTSANNTTNSVARGLVDEQLIRLAQQLVEDIGNRAAADKAAFEQTYRLGFESGIEVGRRQLEAEILADEERFRTHMSSITRMRSHAELEALRWGPDGRERFGDPRPGDHQGGPVSWEAK
ncbi:hypothetical protein [Actinoallomurus sp. NPDC052274]|uniref:hypothetical protein n=1 Tax=Actinoallomurus sp. NPDC052274 TaxID=3155420 RepID=UPI00341244C3